MKPIFPDCVVFYTASRCYIYDAARLPKSVQLIPEATSSRPDSAQLDALFATLEHETITNKKHLLIVLPDEWLAISQHEIARSMSKTLAPLAALAFAVESTFASPETILFNYRLKRLHKRHYLLNLIACPQAFADDLMRPFREKGAQCQIVSYQQWQSLAGKRFALYRLMKQSLNLYQPKQAKEKANQQRWLGLIAISLLLNLVLFGYFYSLNQTHMRLQQNLAKHQSEPFLQPNSVASFPVVLLAKLRTLPMGVRLSKFQTSSTQAQVYLSGRASELNTLVARWRKASPHWQWVMRSLAPANSTDKKEVVDVALVVSTQ